MHSQKGSSMDLAETPVTKLAKQLMNCQMTDEQDRSSNDTKLDTGILRSEQMNQNSNNLELSSIQQQTPILQRQNTVVIDNFETPVSKLTRQFMNFRMSDHLQQSCTSSREYVTPSPSGSIESIYFSAQSTQSICDDAISIPSSMEEGTLVVATTNTAENNIPGQEEVAYLEQGTACKNGGFVESDFGPAQEQETKVQPEDQLEVLDKAFTSNWDPPANMKNDEDSNKMKIQNKNNTNDEPISKEDVITSILKYEQLVEVYLSVTAAEKEKRRNLLRLAKAERDMLQNKLSEAETTYGQLHDRYEKLRASLGESIQHTNEWEDAYETREKQVQAQKKRYQQLKENCEAKLASLKKDSETAERDYELQKQTKQATLRRANLTIENQSKTIELLDDQIRKLNELCDEALRIRQ